MQQRAIYLSLTFVSLLLAMSAERPLLADPLLPNDVLSTLEITKLVAGKTAEVTFVKTKGKGLFYFSPNGIVKQLLSNWLEQGYWQVNESGRLCVSIAGRSMGCRMLIRDKESIGQYIVKRDGKHQRELTYENFYDGNKLLELAGSPSPPLEKLNKEAIVLLFSDTTVESETVRKGRVSFTYYSPDGTLKLLRRGSILAGTWRVTDNDRMCLKIEDSKEKCRIIVKQGMSYHKYIVKKNGQHQQSIKYRRFMPGKQF